MCDFSDNLLGMNVAFFKKLVLVWRSGEGNGTPLQYSCLENPMGGGAWWAAVPGVAKSQTRLSDFTFTFLSHALEKEVCNPLQCSFLKNPRDGGAWWAAVSGVAQSRTRRKRLSSSSSSSMASHTDCIHFQRTQSYPLFF